MVESKFGRKRALARFFAGGLEAYGFRAVIRGATGDVMVTSSAVTGGASRRRASANSVIGGADMFTAVDMRLLRAGVRSAVRASAVFAVGVGLCACSPGDVQLEGKVFEALGMSGNQQRSAAPKLAPRTALVVPPSLERLPEPGKPLDGQDAVLAAINDPDRAKVQDQAKLEAEQAKVCAEVYEPAKARGEPDADSISGPLGPCRPSVLKLVGDPAKIFGTNK